MFFLGLLSTPLPYLLLAAFYFFGFAMGMFNSKTGDEPAEAVSSVTIPAETIKKAPEKGTFYFQINRTPVQNQTDTALAENLAPLFSPDTGPAVIPLRDIKISDFHFSGFRFCRPPPTFC